MSNRFFIGQRVKATNKMDFHMENPCYGTVIGKCSGAILVDWDKKNTGMHTGASSVSQDQRKNPEQDSCFYINDEEIEPLTGMEKIVDALGLYEGQWFDIYDEYDNVMENGPFMFDGEDFVDCNDDVLAPDEYEALMTGHIEILSDREMQLKEEICVLQGQIEEKENELARIRKGA
ncbi:hypothetical protein SELR_pSRC300850 (plasmid) [Selenomonas ruminantium subsp. lactilytica TAM6421]|uniref:Uncharacterized protein n=1 Tax=Selenomonas ruminantium subsp. lactilytica (strain NBRC 103574 / TAM6421) TaxID=927704 RepID=I0GWM1_SELRL|nr:hypothetical protein [Selenomonas ruminantium]BAL85158.1 hypothetical protein SELR_pSRC300850 [Selenomonas ruminantium subsp. lactilytica TAM6421]